MSIDLEPARQAALAELRRQPRAVQWWRPATTVVLVHISVIVLVMLVVASWSSHPRAGEPLWLAGALLLGGVVLGGVVAALRPGGAGTLVGIAGLAALALLAVGASSTARVLPDPLWHDPECALAELGVSMVPMWVMARTLAAFAFVPARALVGGLAAGATGLLVLHFTCPVASFAHWLAFHAAPYCLVAAMTLAWRARLRSRSFAP
jgi:hypothetical protein